MHKLHGGRVAQDEHTGVEHQPAVAVFSKAGQTVDVDNVKARGLQRLDQRIGEPLRQFVQWHETRGAVVRPDTRMAPAITKANAGKLQSAGPDRPEMPKDLAEKARGGD